VCGKGRGVEEFKRGVATKQAALPALSHVARVCVLCERPCFLAYPLSQHLSLRMHATVHGVAQSRGRSPGRGAAQAPQYSARRPHGSEPARSRYFGGYLSESAAQGLREYQYCGSDRSLFLNYVTNPIYNRLVCLFPLWLAPNLITLLGLMCTMCTYVLFH